MHQLRVPRPLRPSSSVVSIAPLLQIASCAPESLRYRSGMDNLNSYVHLIVHLSFYVNVMVLSCNKGLCIDPDDDK